LRKSKEPPQFLTIAQAKQRDVQIIDAVGWALGAIAAEINHSQSSGAHLLSMLGRGANTPERRKVLEAAKELDESKVPARTQQEWLRYQSSGHW
jgi:hypothetical protein